MMAFWTSWIRESLAVATLHHLQLIEQAALLVHLAHELVHVLQGVLGGEAREHEGALERHDLGEIDLGHAPRDLQDRGAGIEAGSPRSARSLVIDAGSGSAGG